MSYLKIIAGLVFPLLAVGGCSQSTDEAGKTLFQSRCAFCHGEEGRGNGPAATTMVPGPANMTSPAFWEGKTPEMLRATILHGVSGSAMPGYEGTLKADELDALVAYIEGFRPATPETTR